LIRVNDLISNMSQTSSLPSGMTGKDPYTMMYGESGLGVPTVSDPYAGRPRDKNHYNDKLMRAARSEYLGESTARGSFNSILKMIQEFQLGGGSNE
jgi:hypothetical protein